MESCKCDVRSKIGKLESGDDRDKEDGVHEPNSEISV